MFEYIYFARPDSIINNKCAYEYRKSLGHQLSIETDVDADLIVPVPDSGVPAAIGFSQNTKKSFLLICFSSVSIRIQQPLRQQP